MSHPLVTDEMVDKADDIFWHGEARSYSPKRMRDAIEAIADDFIEACAQQAELESFEAGVNVRSLKSKPKLA